MPRPRPFLLCTLLALAGCGGKPDATTGGGTTGTDTSTGSTTGGASSSATLPTTSSGSATGSGTTTTGDPDTSTGGTTGPASSSGLPDTTTTTTTDTSAGETTGECVQMPLPGTETSATTGDPDTTNGGNCVDPEGQPQDAACSDESGCGCASGKCFLIPILGGWCGECLDDDDCPGGCTIPNPIAGVGATCNEGGPGDGCNTDATCLNSCAATCAEVLAVPGILTVSTCSRCATDSDCGGARPHCTPVYDIAHFTGELACLADASVANDGACSLTGSGDAVCESGHCGAASIMGLFQIGVCGECEADADCPNGQMCTAPEVDLLGGTLTGSVCF